jgi:glycosyl transferase family 87
MTGSNRNFRIFFGCSAALLLVLGGYVHHEWHSIVGERPNEAWRTASGADFALYYVAGHVANGEGDGRLYEGTPNGSVTNVSSPWVQVARANGVVAMTPYQYPPFFAWLMKPLAKLPVKTAFFVWRELSTLFTLIAIYLALLIAGATDRFQIFVLAAAATLASFPFFEMKEQGQVGGLLLFLWAMGAYLADKKRPVSGAFCFALGTMIKLTPAFVVPLFILRRQWKWLFAYAAWTAAFLGIGVWQLGWANHVTFFTQFMPAMSCGAPSIANKSLMNVVHSLYCLDAFRDTVRIPPLPLGICWLGKTLSASVLGITLIAFWRRTKHSTYLGYEVALLALVSLLISPVTWRHHYVLALLPLLFMWTAPDFGTHAKGTWPLLFAGTVVIGTLFSTAVVQFAHSPVLQLFGSLLIPAAAVLVLWLGLTAYSPEISAATEPTIDEASSFSLSSPVSTAS